MDAWTERPPSAAMSSHLHADSSARRSSGHGPGRMLLEGRLPEPVRASSCRATSQAVEARVTSWGEAHQARHPHQGPGGEKSIASTSIRAACAVRFTNGHLRSVAPHQPVPDLAVGENLQPASGEERDMSFATGTGLSWLSHIESYFPLPEPAERLTSCRFGEDVECVLNLASAHRRRGSAVVGVGAWPVARGEEVD